MEIEALETYDGEPFGIGLGRSIFLTCCDCGLTHAVTLEFSSGTRAILSFSRDDKFTADYRKSVVINWWIKWLTRILK